MAYLADTDLVPSVKRRGRIPVAGFSTTEILTIMNEELVSSLVPLIESVREDFFNTNYDVSLVDGTLDYRIPPRAIGGGLREVQLLDAQGFETNLPRQELGDTFAPANGAFRTNGPYVTLVSNTLTVTDFGVTLRMVYNARPNTLVASTAARTILTITPATKQVTLSSAPPATFTSSVLYDLVRARPIFDCLAIDQAATVGGSTLTFASTLPADLAVGDYVCLAGESPIPQIPAELHPLLCQKTAVACLKALGDTDSLPDAKEELALLTASALKVLTPRVQGEATKIVNRASLFRTRW